MSNLFRNKYYNELFGGKREDEVSEVSDERTEDTRERLERIFGGRRDRDEESRSDDASEGTQERLERIFGGARGKKGTRKPRPAKRSDEELMASGKFRDGGVTSDGRQIFVFKNGAQAVRDDNGRFVILTGAPEALRKYREEHGGKVPRKVRRVSKDQAKKAFSAYWNRRLVQAARYNDQHDLVNKDESGRRIYSVGKDGKRRLSRKKGSKVLAVKRAMTRSMTFDRKKEGWLLDESSDNGYLYLQKEKVRRDALGNPIRNGKGKLSVRRAGVARHGFSGVAPVVPGKYMRSKGPSQKALDAIRAHAESRKGVRAAPKRGPKHPGVDNATRVNAAERIRARNATLAAKKELRSEGSLSPKQRKPKSQMRFE